MKYASFPSWACRLFAQAPNECFWLMTWSFFLLLFLRIWASLLQVLWLHGTLWERAGVHVWRLVYFSERERSVVPLWAVSPGVQTFNTMFGCVILVVDHVFGEASNRCYIYSLYCMLCIWFHLLLMYFCKPCQSRTNFNQLVGNLHVKAWSLTSNFQTTSVESTLC